MTQDVSLREMLERMSHVPDDEAFRWFQDSYIDPFGKCQPGKTYRVTMGQVRREILGEDPVPPVP